MDLRDLIGYRIKELRQFHDLSQAGLSEGICTQAYISKIENGTISVAADILYKISERFGIDINYFFNATSNLRFDYITEVENQARKLVEYKDYSSLKRLVNYEKRGPLFLKNIRYRQFLLWHEAICFRYIEKDLEKSLHLIDEALSLSNTSEKTYSEREIEILLNKANVYIDKNEYKKGLSIYYQSIEHLKKIPDHSLLIEIRLLYNTSRTLLLTQDFEQCILFSKKIVSICQQEQILYGLGQAYYILGKCYLEKGNIQLSKDYFQQAKHVFNFLKHEINYQKSVKQLTKIDESFTNA